MALEETAAVTAQFVTHVLSLEDDEADEALRVLMATIAAVEELVRQRRTAAAAAAAALAYTWVRAGRVALKSINITGNCVNGGYSTESERRFRASTPCVDAPAIHRKRTDISG